MFESIKKLFSRQAPPPTAEPPAQSPPVTTAHAPPPRPAPSAAPATRLALAGAPAPVPVQIGAVVHLPLNDVLARLPAAISPLVLARPGGTFAFPMQNAIEQLGTGAVRVRLADLRQSAPAGTFASDVSQDEALIDLPLPQILAAIGPAAFARRTNQKVTAVPDEVTGVFGAKGSAAPRLAPRSPVAAPPTPAAPAPAPVAARVAVPIPAAPAPIQPPAPLPKPVSPAFVSPPKPPTTPTIKPVSPVASPKPAVPAPLPFAASKPASPLPFATRPAPPPSAPVSTAPSLPIGDDRTVVTTISAVYQTWPDTIRQEIQQNNLGSAAILIPINRLDAGMKTGRVIVAWSDLLSWLKPAPSAQSIQGTVEVELPLSVVAPLFIEKHRGLVPQRRVNVDENIPDLFGGATKPVAPVAAPPPAAPPVAHVPGPTPVQAAPAVQTAPAVRAAPETSALGKLFGQPSKLEWPPQDIARQIAALPGVTGSLLATSDGLLVAGQAPPPLATETLAAFLPQIFGRTANYAEEIKFGTLRAVTIVTDSGPCAMFKAGTLYLAVVGKPGQSLPEATLIRIAAELTKSNQ